MFYRFITFHMDGFIPIMITLIKKRKLELKLAILPEHHILGEYTSQLYEGVPEEMKESFFKTFRAICEGLPVEMFQINKYGNDAIGRFVKHTKRSQEDFNRLIGILNEVSKKYFKVNSYLEKIIPSYSGAHREQCVKKILEEVKKAEANS